MRKLLFLCLSLVLCSGASAAVVPGSAEPRTGDEIVVCGQFFHTGTKVVLWMDPSGYDAYRAELRYPLPDVDRKTKGPMFGDRTAPLTDDQIDKTRGGNWTLDQLQQHVDQFVIHYDVSGVSQECFKALFARGLSVHFMCDIDGTIYQTLDLKESAWHATVANGRSVGVELASIGGYSSPLLLHEWYAKNAKTGHVSITIPPRLGDGGVLTPSFVGHPARNHVIRGSIQGHTYEQYDFTPQQYDALAKLTATLCTVFPKIQCDYPRQKSSLGPPSDAADPQPKPGDPTTRPSAIASPEEKGVLIPHKLSNDQWEEFQGILGHYHVQADKQDPGPAFQWDLLISKAKAQMSADALKNNQHHRHQPARTIPATQPSAVTTAPVRK